MMASEWADNAIRPFRVEVSDGALDDLRERLARTRWPEARGDEDRGVPLAYLKDLVEYWRTGYDWRAQQARLNEVPQVTTTVDGADLHCLHVRSPERNALPLLLIHAWPGSVVDFLHLMGPLAHPRLYGGHPADAFHVVAPSIPGSGFSGLPPDGDWDARRIAAAFDVLMRRLGYWRYGTYGRGFGAQVAWESGRHNAEQVVGVLGLGGQDGAAEAARPSRALAYALMDSPVGQLAWMVDGLCEDAQPLAADAEGRDRILTSVMVHWLTGTVGWGARQSDQGVDQDPPRDSTNSASLPPVDWEASRGWEPIDRVVEQIRAYFRATR
jgi:pimeloyl-ACP methyl ester carboxylesterase